jgi:hypothetical protein
MTKKPASKKSLLAKIKKPQFHGVTKNQQYALVSMMIESRLSSREFINHYNSNPQIRVGQIKKITGTIRKWKILVDNGLLKPSDVGEKAIRSTHWGFRPEPFAWPPEEPPEKTPSTESDEAVESEPEPEPDEGVTEQTKLLCLRLKNHKALGFSMLEIRLTDNGYGVFATEDIECVTNEKKDWKSSQAICEYYGASLAYKLTKRKGYDTEYCMLHKPGYVVDAKQFETYSFGRYINCGIYKKNQNVDWKPHPTKRNVINIYPIKNIKRGEQLLTLYGFEYWISAINRGRMSAEFAAKYKAHFAREAGKVGFAFEWER